LPCLADTQLYKIYLLIKIFENQRLAPSVQEYILYI